ncbi:MFS transporter [Rhodococcus koreensis]
MTETTSSAATAQVADEQQDRTIPHPTSALLAVGTGALIVSLTQTMLVPVLSELPTALNTSVVNVQWLLTSTLMVAAISVPVMGRLADMYGKRRILLVALFALTIGSLIDALASDVGVMIVGRMIQGVSMSAIPVGISLLSATLPAERVPRAIAMVSAMLGVGGALGLPLAAYLGAYADYHVLFWVTVVGGVLALLATLVWVPEADSVPGGRVDLIGLALFATGILCLLMPLAQGAQWGWTSPTTLGVSIAAVAVLIAFVAFERRHRDPLVDVKEVSRAPIAITNIASILFGFALYASMIGTAGFVQAPVETGYGFGASIVQGGLCLLPSGLLMLVVSPVSARLISLRGPEAALVVGGVVLSAGWVLRILLSDSIWQVIIGTCVVGVGTGIGYSGMPALINKYTDRRSLGAANSLNTLSRHVGSASASALGGSLFVMSTVLIGGNEYPSLAAYNMLFGICAVTAILAAALMLAMPRKNLTRSEDDK